MIKPPQELIDAFFTWLKNDPHFQQEDWYQETINERSLAALSKDDFIDFFTKFSAEGGKVQSGGHRTKNLFKKVITENYQSFRDLVMMPFQQDFDPKSWLEEAKNIKYFGKGISTIYLNRVDKNRFAIINNKTRNALALLDVKVPANPAKAHEVVVKAQKQLINWYPKFDNFFRTDAFNHFMIGTNEGVAAVKKLLQQKPSHSSLSKQDLYDFIQKMRVIHCPDERLSYRLKHENSARKILTQKPFADLTAEDWSEFFQVVNGDWWEGKELETRFGLSLRGNNRIYMLKNVALLNACTADLWNCDEKEIDQFLDKWWKEPIHGAGTGFQTLLLYLRTKGRFNVWLPMMAKGIDKYTGTTSTMNRSAENYKAYNSRVNVFMEEHGLTPQEADIILCIDETVKPMSHQHNIPLNIILYGPPGTGKTYYSIEEAVRICDGDVSDEREKVSDRFKELQRDDRINFVTFHQSYSYEEFVEGIRPVLEENGGGKSKGLSESIRYECRKGIFKKISELAETSGIVSEKKYELDTDKTTVWNMSLGATQNPNDANFYDDCIENKYIRYRFWDMNYSDSDNHKPMYKRSYPRRARESGYGIVSIDLFKNEMQRDDLVIISEGNEKIRAIGKIIGDYEYFKEQEQHLYKRDVDWLFVAKNHIPSDKLLTKNFIQQTIYRLSPKYLKLDAINELLSGDKKKARKNYVLIIDEINRGNISKILGELITLIEPDKRLGQENELKVRLPYSGDEFGVPDNLYIIGTMNTADRSIAFMDTALRRRFQFNEMIPDASIVGDTVGDNGILEDVNVAKLLEILNQRIEVLYDRDHQLGHSYFMKVESLKELRAAFLGNIIPLLQEYFYEDWEKLCAVLGCSYNPETGKSTSSNKYPIIKVETLGASIIPGYDHDDYENRLHFAINQDFIDASEENLAIFFNSIINLHSSKGID